MSLKLYLAAPLALAPDMVRWACCLRVAGFSVTSQWHDIVTAGASDPVSGDLRRRILEANIQDLLAADVTIVNTTAGIPGATLCEVGYALSRGQRVIWVQPRTRRPDGVKHTNIFDAHPLVRVVHEITDVVPLLREIAATSRLETLPEIVVDMSEFEEAG